MPVNRMRGPASILSSAITTGSIAGIGFLTMISIVEGLEASDESSLGVGVAVDVALGGLDRAMAGEQLDVTEARPCPPCLSGRVGNERPSPAMGRAPLRPKRAK